MPARHTDVEMKKYTIKKQLSALEETFSEEEKFVEGDRWVGTRNAAARHDLCGVWGVVVEKAVLR